MALDVAQQEQPRSSGMFTHTHQPERTPVPPGQHDPLARPVHGDAIHILPKLEANVHTDTHIPSSAGVSGTASLDGQVAQHLNEAKIEAALTASHIVVQPAYRPKRVGQLDTKGLEAKWGKARGEPEDAWTRRKREQKEALSAKEQQQATLRGADRVKELPVPAKSVEIHASAMSSRSSWRDSEPAQHDMVRLFAASSALLGGGKVRPGTAAVAVESTATSAGRPPRKHEVATANRETLASHAGNIPVSGGQPLLRRARASADAWVAPPDDNLGPTPATHRQSRNFAAGTSKNSITSEEPFKFEW